MAHTENFQPLIPFSDLLHIQREATFGISGLIHFELLGHEQRWLNI